MSKKYQIFVSSTYQDLVEERDQVIKAILEMGHIPVGMEMFSAADDEQWKIIARQIDDIDYYAVLVAHRYGSVTADGISYTEKEFDYAASKGVPILGFCIDESAAWPNDRCDTDSKSKRRLQSFKKKIKSRLIHFWSSKEELHGKFSISLMKAITANPRIGWIRASEGTGVEVTKELTRLSSENSILRSRVEELERQKTELDDDVRKIVRVLHGNHRNFKVRTKESAQWADAEVYQHTLAEIFQWTAPSLISESSNYEFAENIALRIVGTDYYQNFPIGSNIVTEFIADLAALDIVEPSKKKHPVSDTTSYWSLTKLGRKVHAEFRRIALEEYLPAADAKPEDG
ncbi:MAG TPA: DUF4062 domain-containing protein [Cellvibrionaceae bacterium]|nr:DUF4062 domain-containing protein [Cellvibrionaceae bacterium]